MQGAELEVDGDTARLNGDLTFTTVTRLYERMAAVKKAGEMPRVIELADVNQIDSSGLALLLEWQAQFTKGSETSTRLEIRHPPEALVKIARLCDAEDYLSSDGSNPRRGPPQ